MRNRITWVRRLAVWVLAVCAVQAAEAKYFVGKVIGEDSLSVIYASIYMQEHPMTGTVSGMEGDFSLEIPDSVRGNVIISCVGYKTKVLKYNSFRDSVPCVITMDEDAIELEGTVVEGKAKRRNRKRTMEELLKNIINRMEVDFPDEPAKYKVKSDVRLSEEDKVITYEELLGYIVQLPATDGRNTDSVQFKGLYCKRYIDEDTEAKARSAVGHIKSDRTYDFANEVDSGAITHQYLWGGNLKYIIQELAEKPKKWELGKENDSLSVMTYTDKYNFLGIVKAEMKYHIIIDNYTYRIYRVSEEVNAQINIPFGYKLKEGELRWLNAISMGRQFHKFRLKKASVKVRRNVYYNTLRDVNHPDKKVMAADFEITNNKKLTLHYNTRANAEVLEIEDKNVKPFTRRELEQNVKRENVPLSSIQ